MILTSSGSTTNSSEPLTATPRTRIGSPASSRESQGRDNERPARWHPPNGPVSVCLATSVQMPATVLASTTLAVELIVQVPFIGLDILQAVFGLIAVALTVLA